ncbi:MAG: Crp/Fnr family transcriptional regulator [Paracoccaceae bacterium]
MVMSALPSSLKSCSDCPIKYRAVCAKCDSDELTQLEAIKYYRRYEAGQSILFAGDKSEFVASIVSGVATLTQTMSDGRVQMVGLMLPSDFIGWPNRKTVSYDVVATTDMVLCCFRRKPFEDLIQQVPHIGQRLLEMTMDELDQSREWMLLLGRKTAREKISSLLCMLARRTVSLEASGSTGPIRFELPLTREASSNYLGLTIETVSRQISALKRDGLIELDGKRHIIIPDLDSLMLETGDDTDGGILI